MIKFGSVCSGIEAASVAWEPLGWEPAWFSEIEAFPSAVLDHHWPHVENLGDMTTLPRRVLQGSVEAPDVLVGGTPCQAFSVAGMREGLADERGQLTIKYVELANAIDIVRHRAGKPACITVWENVPGVLSDKANAFGCFLGALAGESCELQPPGGKWKNAGCVYGPTRAIAWRVLDAQYFGVAQRRRRVFVVASARTDIDPAAVLFESEGVRRDTPPSRKKGEGFTYDVAPSLTSSGRGVERAGETRGQDPVVAFGQNRLTGPVETSHALNAHGGPYGRLDFESETFLVSSGVRRLTPIECERLQGMPDGHTLIPTSKRNWHREREEMRAYFRRTFQDIADEEIDRLAADGPRYKAIGNSMAVPVMHWIGKRIQHEAER